MTKHRTYRDNEIYGRLMWSPMRWRSSTVARTIQSGCRCGRNIVPSVAQQLAEIMPLPINIILGQQICLSDRSYVTVCQQIPQRCVAVTLLSDGDSD